MTQETKSAQAEAPAPSLEDLKAQLAKASAAGDIDEILSLAKQVEGQRVAAAKAEHEKLVKARTALGLRIIEVAKPHLAPFESDVVRLGGVLRLMWSPTESLFDAAVTSKAEPKPPGARVAAAKGSAADRYGMPLGAIYERFANAEERAAHDGAATNSERWNIKTRVMKRAVSEGLLHEVS
jgi:hypothetical protein